MSFGARNRLALLAPVAFVFVLAAENAPTAHEDSTFVIAAAQGYGVEDCLAEGGECGHAVADAWCAAEGHGAARKFGRSDSSGPADARPFFITCGD